MIVDAVGESWWLTVVGSDALDEGNTPDTAGGTVSAEVADLPDEYWSWNFEKTLYCRFFGGTATAFAG